MTRIDAPTRWVELQPRVYVKNEADLAAARKVLDGITLQPLSQYTGVAAPQPAEYEYEFPRMAAAVATSHMQFDDPLQFWRICSAAMNENPPPRNEIEAVLPQYRYLGLELGRPWRADAVNPLIVAAMKKASQQIGELALGTLPLAGRLVNGWVIPPADIGVWGTDYLSRLDVAIFGLTANTAIQAVYYAAVRDGHNEPLTGGRNYTITFKGPMLYARHVPPGFWSVTAYDNVTGYSVPNPINRYSLGSQSDLKKNPDGSFTMYLQATTPGPDKESNWLPTPNGPFYLLLRNFAPVPELVAALKSPATFDGPPAVMPVDRK